jgi:hypothetical protein
MITLKYQFICAEVAELVDALGSGSSVSNHMGVQVPPSAPPGIQAAIEADCGFFWR